jgi:hypothetical protein
MSDLTRILKRRNIHIRSILTLEMRWSPTTGTKQPYERVRGQRLIPNYDAWVRNHWTYVKDVIQ